MTAVHALDAYYLALTLLVTVGYQLLGFAIAWTFQFDKITDFTGGSNFFLLALLTLLIGQTFDARHVVVSVLVMVWATRLAGFLLFRVLKMGSDTRFDDIRSHFFKFMGFWIGQIVWVWVVSLPVTILNSPAVTDGAAPAFGTSKDIAGLVLWAIGWVIESVADAEKFYYKSTKPPKYLPNTYGLWKWSRHPPYFGEILCWWGIWIISISPSVDGEVSSRARAAQYGAVVSPLFTMLLLIFASGIPTAEKPTAKRFFLFSHGPSSPAVQQRQDVSGEEVEGYRQAWPRYKQYVSETSLLVPMPRRVYRVMPVWVKRWVFLDFPWFGFDEKAEGPGLLEEERRKVEEREA